MFGEEYKEYTYCTKAIYVDFIHELEVNGGNLVTKLTASPTIVQEVSCHPPSTVAWVQTQARSLGTSVDGGALEHVFSEDFCFRC
jgi:hypothetical protein